MRGGLPGRGTPPPLMPHDGGREAGRRDLQAIRADPATCARPLRGVHAPREALAVRTSDRAAEERA